MQIVRILKATLFFVLLFVLPCGVVKAADESYLQTLSGPIKQGDSCTVIDDKFLHFEVNDWNALQNLSVDNKITFELRQDTTIYYYGKPFTCTLNVSIRYFTSRDQQTPDELNNINLVVKYDTTTGSFTPVATSYQFKNAFKVTVVVNSITSPELGAELPAIFRLKNQIFIRRKYPFNPNINASFKLQESVSRKAVLANPMLLVCMAATPVPTTVENQLTISWDQKDFGNSEAYDIEWTYIDSKSSRGEEIFNNYGGESGPFTIPESKMEEWMRHDNSRVTVTGSSYTLNLPYPSGYVLVRIRGVYYQNGTNLRLTTPWQYQNGTGVGCVYLAGHEADLNWQYSASFAEEGKRKEVVTYFDGSLRNRQTVTLNNEDQVAVVAETIYDRMGRPTANILPAPVNAKKLQFYPGINTNEAGVPYSFSDISAASGANCSIGALPLSTSGSTIEKSLGLGGAAQYYSPSNAFKDKINYYFSKYVPNAEKFPLAVTEYTPDNTGRIRRQGGVGPIFQIGEGKETQYFYGKPLQKELDRLFGVEVGYASHYLKNMVVDPNGQVSVSYVDPNGRTIATALAGGAPASLDALPAATTPSAITPLNEVLIRPLDFKADGLQMQASATFLAAVPNEDFKVHFSVSPAALVTTLGGSQQFCSNCYYEVLLKVTNDCGDEVGTKTTAPFQINDNTCHNNAVVIDDYAPVHIGKIGEYTVSYTLRLSEQVIKDQTDFYIANNTNLKTLQRFFNDELLQAELTGCYSECSTCNEKLGTSEQFREKTMALLQQLKAERYTAFPSFDLNNAEVQNWITNTYDELKAHCQEISANCLPPSPCEQKLEQLKRDVRPGGQYALVNFDEPSQSYSYTDREISVLRLYNQPDFPDITFTDDNNTTRTTKSLSESDFIKEYLKHPEWADYFVTHHIEYCSYEWCKDASYSAPSYNNEVSYRFDESLKNLKGAEAQSKGYYDRANYLALLDKDPFFNGGRGAGLLKTQMADELSDLSNSLLIKVYDQNNILRPAKNILELIDWMLYCKPTDPNASSSDVSNSWNCWPNSSCRSLSREWELYRNYYLQLKGKYLVIAKRQAVPNCTSCFVGSDLLSAVNAVPSGGCPQPTSSSETCPPASEFYTEERNLRKTSFDCLEFEWTQVVVHTGGPVTQKVKVQVMEEKRNSTSTTTYERWVTFEPGQSEVELGTYHSIDASATCPLLAYQFWMGTSSPTCWNPKGPSSLCSDDPRYPLYQNKIRVFNEYSNPAAYTNCLAPTPPYTDEQASLVPLRQEATENLKADTAAWFQRLRAVRDEEFTDLASTTLSDANLLRLIDQLYIVAKYYIDYSNIPKDNIRPVSKLPDGWVASNNSNNFRDVFDDYIGTSVVERGFGPELLPGIFPYDKTPVNANPNAGEVNDYIRNTLTALKNRLSPTATTEQFHDFLKQELQEDYNLTLDQLSELTTKCTNGCKLLEVPMLLPAVFAAPTSISKVQPWMSCEAISNLRNSFTADYPNVTSGTKLYRYLLTNYLNSNLGYSLSYGDYDNFTSGCAVNSTIVLYNKPASPSVPTDDFACAASIITGAFERAGQAYEQYIEEERKSFRNALISLCLSNAATASVEGKQYEYHYTLYYYDQSGNLVKTIPPEGVQLLSDDKLAQVEAFRNAEPSTCTGAGIPSTEDLTTTFNGVSTGLSSNSAQALEAWLYSGANTSPRQVRFVTPDQKYFYQAAIADQKLWVELYSLQPTTDGSLEIVRSNSAVADISSISVQTWSHLFVQSPSLTGQDLQLYLDGQKLVNLSASSTPPYPFAWEISGSGSNTMVPANDLALLKHLRVYSRLASDAEILANAKNPCLSPVDALAVSGNPLTVWGRFNLPQPGSETTLGPNSTVESSVPNPFVVPDHRIATYYQYNSLNQVIAQSSPDGGASTFWYDRLGRLAISQNEEQKTPQHESTDNPANRFSYTRYDALGRIKEVGEKIGGDPVSEDMVRQDAGLQAWYSSGTNRQVTLTTYDAAPSWAPASLAGSQHNLRKRVAATALLESSSDPAAGRLSASYYSYDLLGNVSELVQENTALAGKQVQYVTGGTGLKHIKYEYDLVSGKVNKVLYQDGKWDQFYYQYLYDAENRVVKALSSRNNYADPNEWVTEATYRYYLHGPLARVELGKNKVQGLDYAYTLQGWLKGVNSQVLSADWDMSGDGKVGSSFDRTARDVVGISLGYFPGDYKPLGGTQAPAFGLNYTYPALQASSESGKALYNGNISHATYAIGKLDDGKAVGYTYRYDQLNRLKAMDHHRWADGTLSWGTGDMVDAYKEQITYDGNGNILSYLRNGAGKSGMPLEMDNLAYSYNWVNGRLVNNKLRHVQETTLIPSDNYRADLNGTEDLESQPVDNYSYDRIGNLTGDQKADIQGIDWTVYGKIASILKTDDTRISYGYDASGNRITKTVKYKGDPAKVTTTYYVRDAQGNVLGVYSDKVGTGFAWQEQHLYGSSRLGMVQPNFSIAAGQPLGSEAYSGSGDPLTNGIVGLRRYELSNHLGNVLAVVSDRSIGHDAGNGTVDYYTVEVMSAQDYYPFGMGMPGRKGRLVQNETTKAWEWKEEGNEYRYGFNGKENDNEIKGDGNQIDYGMRIYDPRIGKFLSVDPLTKSYPMLTPYQYASNNPVQNIDIDGLEGLAGQLASPGKWHIPGDANDDGHYTKQEIKQGTKIMTKTGAVAFHGVLLFAAPQVGIPLTITFLTGAPTTPSPQAMAGNAESQALRQGEIALDEASAETTTATRGMSNGLTKANKGTAVQNTSNSAAMANGGNAPVNLSAREATWVENFISNKPSPNVGIFTESALSTKALRELSNKLGGVEVAQVFVKTKTGGYYNVFYGTPRSIEVPNFEGGTPYLINHVHPSGNNMPSKSDNLLLERLQEIQKQNGMPVQNSSQIVPIGSANRKFNTSSQTKGD